MKKIFAFDMDGTILDDHDNLHPKTVDALVKIKLQGHILMIATGRPYNDVARSLGKDIEYFDYVICNNGAYTINIKTQEVDELKPLSLDPINKMIEIGKKYNCFFAIHGNRNAERTFLGSVNNVDWDSPEFFEFKKFKDEFIPIEDLLAWAKSQHIRQCSLRSTPETINKIKNLFDEYSKDVDIYIANSLYLDINPKGASKWMGISKLAEKLNVSQKNTIAFGDSDNDLSMLEKSGIGICMGNGSKNAKKMADMVIGNNNSDAIAITINKLINN